MPRKALKFPLRSKSAAFTFMGEPTLENCFPEEIGEEQRSPVAFLSIPGSVDFAAPAEDPSRGFFGIDDDEALYSAHLSKLYRIDSAGSATEVDGTLPGSLPIIAARGAAVAKTATVTISIATPGVITDPLHELRSGDIVRFSTDGTLPTGLSDSVDYYVLASGLTANTYKVSTSAGGAAVNTSGSQSGTHTRTNQFNTIQTAIVTDAATYVMERDTLHFLDLPETANSVCVLNFRHIYGTDSGKCYYSAVNDARTISGFFEAEKLPDGLVRAFVIRGELWLFGKGKSGGQGSIEIWTGSSSPSAPFRPLGGAYIDMGCASRDSVVPWDGGVAFLGTDGLYYKAAGYNRIPISDPSLERLIARVSDKTTIRAYTHTYNGHTFLVLGCASWTKALDQRTGFWHDRKSYLRDDWLAWPGIEFFGKTLVGDKTSGAIRQLSESTYTEDGAHIICKLRLPAISAYPAALYLNRVDVDLLTGNGLNVASTVDGYEGKVMLSGSIDGGHTFPVYQELSTGAQGDYLPGVSFGELGLSEARGWVLEISVSGPTARGFLLGDIDAEAAPI